MSARFPFAGCNVVIVRIFFTMQFTPRRYATSLPLSGSVLMIGGRTEDGEYLDGAWFWNYVTEQCVPLKNKNRM